MAIAWSSDKQPAQTGIVETIASARHESARTPFLWIRNGNPPAVTGRTCHRESADGGQAWLTWEWDGTRLAVSADPFGFIPAFVYCHGSEVGLSTSLDRLLQLARGVELDRTALSVFLRLGFFIGDDTPFREIRAVPPAARLLWQNGRLTWRGKPYVVPPTHPSRSAAIDEAIALTARAVEQRQTNDDCAVPLSGGRDSRHILLALLQLGRKPQFAVTVARLPPAAAEDQRIAALLTSQHGIHHVIAAPDRAPASAEAHKNVITHYCADEHAWFLPMIARVNSSACACYEGIGGSLWTTGWLPDVSSRALWQRGETRDVARQMLRQYSIVGEPFLAALLGDDAFGLEVAVTHLSEELERHRAAPDPGKSFHFWNRLRRELALIPYGPLRARNAVYTPLVDRALVDFLLSLAPEIVSPVLSRSDKSFHSLALERAFPESAAMPFERIDAPATDARPLNRALTTAVARHLLSRRQWGVMQSRYLLPRAAYTLANARYAATSRWLATNALYLAQIAEAVQ